MITNAVFILPTSFKKPVSFGSTVKMDALIEYLDEKTQTCKFKNVLSDISQVYRVFLPSWTTTTIPLTQPVYVMTLITAVPDQLFISETEYPVLVKYIQDTFVKAIEIHVKKEEYIQLEHAYCIYVNYVKKRSFMVVYGDLMYDVDFDHCPRSWNRINKMKQDIDIDSQLSS